MKKKKEIIDIVMRKLHAYVTQRLQKEGREKHEGLDRIKGIKYKWGGGQIRKRKNKLTNGQFFKMESDTLIIFSRDKRKLFITLLP